LQLIDIKCIMDIAPPSSPLSLNWT
jgi:hypothetical protein